MNTCHLANIYEIQLDNFIRFQITFQSYLQNQNLLVITDTNTQHTRNTHNTRNTHTQYKNFQIFYRFLIESQNDFSFLIYSIQRSTFWDLQVFSLFHLSCRFCLLKHLISLLVHINSTLSYSYSLMRLN